MMSNENDPIKSQTALKEEETLKFWNDIEAFKKTVEIPHEGGVKGEFIFFDGPPFATGTPHYGHLLASAIKDAVPRYQTMKGLKVLRRWGWDCHGLPIENIVEKDLGISGKKQIEEMGLEKFNEHARSKVLTYVDEWKKTIERFARWTEFDGSYKTMDNSYIESVWWGLKKLHSEDKIYESVKVLMYCPRCETPLSNAEVAMDNSYKDITDISVYVKFKLINDVSVIPDLVRNPVRENQNSNLDARLDSRLRGNDNTSEDDNTGARLDSGLRRNDNTSGNDNAGEGGNTGANTYILAWTTTPWTLPGNVALAINPDLDYVEVEGEVPGNTYIVASTLVEKVFKTNFKILRTFKGSELIGKSYEPIFDYYKNIELKNKENGWKIYAGDFVTTTDGTGIVHIAPAFGEDDLRLAKANNLPIIHHVDGTGKFKPEIIDFAGQLVKPADTKEEPNKHQSADIEIIKYLAHNGKLFEKEKLIHSYPHCYRCETPLYYYAIPAWFINVQSSKEKFLKLNEKVNWIPSHLKEGRFKNVMENAPDWNISRNRFWATPLPIWKGTETKELEVLGSLDDIKERTKSTNKYFVMRHGEGEQNVLNILSSKVDNPHHLTEKGKEQTLATAEKLKDKKITKIIASPFVRTKETAEIVAETFGIPAEEIVYDVRLGEIDLGDFNMKAFESYGAFYSSFEEMLEKPVPGGESHNDLRKRVGQFLYEIDKKYSDENILLVTHESPAWALCSVAIGADKIKAEEMWKEKREFITTAEYKEFDFAPIPHNALYELDFHRPYIDAITYPAPSGQGMMKRIPEVLDCWFESSSMPYASQHYPFENQDFFKTHFPADFIAEYIAQTRTWFYYTHAISAMLFDNIAFKNVITTGTVLAEGGQKMSKSKNNYPDPALMFDKYGVDAVRFYMLSSPLMRSEDLNFAEREVDEIHKKIILRMRNVLSFYEMYKSPASVIPDLVRNPVSHSNSISDSFGLDSGLRRNNNAGEGGIPMKNNSSNVLDRWIIERLRELCDAVTKAMDAYEIDQALKPVLPFVEDLSTWYLRRSRDRMKEDGEDKDLACATLRYVLFRFAQITAPFMPFIAEEIYRGVRGNEDEESVHFTVWPNESESFSEKIKGIFVKNKIIEDMEKVRNIVSLALEARSKALIKVKQPLLTLTLKGDEEIVLNDEYASLIRDEVNVKNIVSDITIEPILVLDTNITPELKEEGEYRELLRAIQDLRKRKGLTPKDKPKLIIVCDDATKVFIEKYKNQLEKSASLFSVSFEGEDGEEIIIGDKKIKLELSL
jgi:isoleucyl-tRNA synthetase